MSYGYGGPRWGQGDETTEIAREKAEKAEKLQHDHPSEQLKVLANPQNKQQSSPIVESKESKNSEKPPIQQTAPTKKPGFFNRIRNLFNRPPSSPQQNTQLPPQQQKSTLNPIYNAPDPSIIQNTPGNVVSSNEVKLGFPANPSNPSSTQEITANFIQITPDVFIKQVFEEVKNIINSSNSNKKAEIINIIDNCINYINNPEAKIIFTGSSSNLENSKLYYQLVQGFCYNVAYIFRDILDKKTGSDKLLLFQNQYNALCEMYNKIVGNSAEVIRQLEDEIKQSNCENKKLSEMQGVIAANFNEIIEEKKKEVAGLQARCPEGDCDESDDELDCEECDEKPLPATQVATQSSQQNSQNSTIQSVAVASQITSKAQEEAKKKRENSGLNGSRTNAFNSTEIVKLNITISDQTTKIEDKTDEIKGKEAEIEDLKKQLAGNSSKRSELEAQLKEKEEKLAKLTEELFALNAKQQESKAALEKATANANAARQEAQKTKTNTNTALRNTQTTYNLQITENLAKISELKQQLSKSTENAQENQKIKQQIKQLQQEIINRKTALQNAANKAKQNSQDYQAAIKEVQSARNAALAEKSEAQDARNTAIQNAATTKLKLKELQKKYDDYTIEEAIKKRAANVAAAEAETKRVAEAESKRLKEEEEEKTKLKQKIQSYTSLEVNYGKINTTENIQKLASNSDTRFDKTKQNTILFNGGTLKDINTLSSENELIKLREIISTMDTVNEEFINILEDLEGIIRVIVRIKPTSETGSIISSLDTNSKKYKFTVLCKSKSTEYSDYYNIFPDPPFSNYGVYSGISQIRDNAAKTIINSAKLSELSHNVQSYTPFNLKKSFDQVKQGYSIVLFGYGYSGSGKTYTLLGSEAKENTPAINGVLQYGIEDLIKSGSQIKLKYIFEEYIGNINDIFNVSDNNTCTIKNIIGNIFMLYNSDNQGDNKFTTHFSNYISNITIDSLQLTDLKDLTDFQQNLQDFTPKFQKLQDLIATKRKEGNNPRIKATINNPESSRSHLYIVFEVQTGDKTGFITITDMAGREDPRNILQKLIPYKKTKAVLGNEPELDKTIFYQVPDSTKLFTLFGMKSYSIYDNLKKCIDVNEVDCGYEPDVKTPSKLEKYYKTLDNTKYDDETKNFILIEETKKIKITDKDIYIKNIIKEGFYINESINHLKYYFLNKNKQCKCELMKSNDITLYNPEKYYINPQIYMKDEDHCKTQTNQIKNIKKNEYINTEDKRSNVFGTLKTQGPIPCCLTIPILQFLDTGLVTDSKLPTKFIMICAIRQETEYCQDVIDTLNFANSISIKST
jgi:hypothetical protein